MNVRLFVGFEQLGHLEEVPDFAQEVLGEIFDVFVVGETRIASRHTQHLGVSTGFVFHPEHRYRSNHHVTARKRGLAQPYGLISRSVDPDDRRSALIRITPAGRRIADRGIEIIADAHNQMISGLSATEQRTLSRLVTTLVEDVSADIEVGT